MQAPKRMFSRYDTDGNEIQRVLFFDVPDEAQGLGQADIARLFGRYLPDVLFIEFDVIGNPGGNGAHPIIKSVAVHLAPVNASVK